MGCTESKTREETNGFVVIEEIAIEQETVTPNVHVNQSDTEGIPLQLDPAEEKRIKRKAKAKEAMEQLSDEHLATWREAFSMFDQDNNGMISADEMMHVMTSLGMNPTKQETKDIINEFDLDKSEHIEFEEFCQMMAKWMSEQPAASDHESELTCAFKAFDKDGSGKINQEELRTVMDSLGEKLTEEELREMIQEADIDGDGEIDYKEFVNMMMSKT